MNYWRRLDLEWKVLLLAAVLFIAFAWPVQRFFISRLSETLTQSIDPHLEQTLRNELAKSAGEEHAVIKEHLLRYRQTRVLIPIVVKEQRQLLFALSIGLFALFILLAYWVLKRLTRPLRNLANAVDKIGKGETIALGHSSGGALGIVEQAVINLQDELLTLREKAHIQGMESAWKDIARVMAHEIKNPLTPIRLTLDRIEERTGSGQGVSNEELIRFLSRINTQVDMLERLVDQFRSFSREQEVHLSEVDCSVLIRSVAEDMGPKIATRVTGTATLRSDPHLLQQVFLNIWKNALEAGATQITATITAGISDTTITIRDNGPGIPPEHLERVWLPYVTFKKNGTGLGLPVVKRLVETLDGRITLASPKNGGVIVSLVFPSKNVKENK